MQTKKIVFNAIALLVVAAFLLSACGTSGSSAPDVAAGYTGTKITTVPQDLVTACKKEGMLTIIATPPDWANYGEIFSDFELTSGVKINSLDPNAGSADELAAIEANKGNTGPQAPDIVDVGYAYGATGIAAGDYQAYKVSTWDKIPATVLGKPKPYRHPQLLTLPSKVASPINQHDMQFLSFSFLPVAGLKGIELFNSFLTFCTNSENNAVLVSRAYVSQSFTSQGSMLAIRQV